MLGTKLYLTHLLPLSVNSWDVKNIIVALLNLAALEFSIQPHSFQALVMLRVIHENDLGSNHIWGPLMGTSCEQKLLLEVFCNECL